MKYGFFGEVLLHCILFVLFKAKPLIARGYFYDPLENSETKGFDSYLLIEHAHQTELWFGETKFHIRHTRAIKDVLDKISNTLSDKYLNKTVLSIYNHKNDLNIKGSKIEKILEAWQDNPSLSIAAELKKHNIKLVYPILLLYEEHANGYDHSINMITRYIKDNFKPIKYSLTIEYSVFFILMPVSGVKEIKKEVLQWIESKRPVLS